MEVLTTDLLYFIISDIAAFVKMMRVNTSYCSLSTNPTILQLIAQRYNYKLRAGDTLPLIGKRIAHYHLLPWSKRYTTVYQYQLLSSNQLPPLLQLPTLITACISGAYIDVIRSIKKRGDDTRVCSRPRITRAMPSLEDLRSAGLNDREIAAVAVIYDDVETYKQLKVHPLTGGVNDVGARNIFRYLINSDEYPAVVSYARQIFLQRDLAEVHFEEKGYYIEDI